MMLPSHFKTKTKSLFLPGLSWWSEEPWWKWTPHPTSSASAGSSTGCAARRGWCEGPPAVGGRESTAGTSSFLPPDGQHGQCTSFQTQTYRWLQQRQTKQTNTKQKNITIGFPVISSWTTKGAPSSGGLWPLLFHQDWCWGHRYDPLKLDKGGASISSPWPPTGLWSPWAQGPQGPQGGALEVMWQGPGAPWGCWEDKVFIRDSIIWSHFIMWKKNKTISVVFVR